MSGKRITRSTTAKNAKKAKLDEVKDDNELKELAPNQKSKSTNKSAKGNQVQKKLRSAPKNSKSAQDKGKLAQKKAKSSEKKVEASEKADEASENQVELSEKADEASGKKDELSEDSVESIDKNDEPSEKADEPSENKVEPMEKDDADPDEGKVETIAKVKPSTDATSNLRITSWNVNGVRANLKKNGLKWLLEDDSDIICLQETKCSDNAIPSELKDLENYHCYWNNANKRGYSGVAVFAKVEPIKVSYGIESEEHDSEGRCITLEFDNYYLVNTYVPNSQRKLIRLEYRKKWDLNFQLYLTKLAAEKSVILCGDLNVSHQEIDLANPKTNKKNPGFTQEERDGFSTLLKAGFIDSFRQLYPDATEKYTFWSNLGNSRARNIGWRLDYFVLSENLKSNLCDSIIHSSVMGSDHCPISLRLSL